MGGEGFLLLRKGASCFLKKGSFLPTKKGEALQKYCSKKRGGGGSPPSLGEK